MKLHLLLFFLIGFLIINEGIAIRHKTLTSLYMSQRHRAQKMRSFCEICILVIQMKQRGFPHLCSGLSQDHWETCIMVVESLLREDKAVTYWLKKGCIFLDSTGPNVITPCTALAICSWTPNLFAQPPSVVRDSVESLCPKDTHFLPTIPNEFSNPPTTS